MIGSQKCSYSGTGTEIQDETWSWSSGSYSGYGTVVWVLRIFLPVLLSHTLLLASRNDFRQAQLCSFIHSTRWLYQLMFSDLHTWNTSRMNFCVNPLLCKLFHWIKNNSFYTQKWGLLPINEWIARICTYINSRAFVLHLLLTLIYLDDLDQCCITEVLLSTHHLFVIMCDVQEKWSSFETICIV